jgi:CheY-specific phosphatase CheX
MTAAGSNTDAAFPPIIADAVKVAVENTFAKICGEKPAYQSNGSHVSNDSCVAGIISFIGETSWSLSLILTREAAPAFAQTFTGIEIEFDTPDMGDVAAELVNVLAGEVVAQLAHRRFKAQMSLPTVVRGHLLELIPERREAVKRLDFAAKQGNFWLRLASAIRGQELGRMPGT